MSPVFAAIIGIAGLSLLLAIGMPVGFSLALMGVVGFGLVVAPDPALWLLGIEPYAHGSSFIFTAIPMFLLMGSFAAASGISADVFNTANKWLGRLPGGLAIATISGCAGFAAASGSSLATASAMGKISIPQMRRLNYHPRLASGVVAAGGTLGILIPPSIGLVVYGVITETHIGKLLIAGIIPGILLATLMIVVIYVMVRINPQLAPQAESVSWKARFSSLWGVWGILTLFLLVMGGIYGGIFTPTEAAVENLRREGLSERGIHHVGDVMYDAALLFGQKAEEQSSIVAELGLTPGNFILATVHRAENTDNHERLRAIFGALSTISEECSIVLPLHPRTGDALAKAGIEAAESRGLTLIEPASYLDMVQLQRNARLIVTDSGGVQKEAFFHQVPCVTLRDTTEWVELVTMGWNRLAPPTGAHEVATAIAMALEQRPAPAESPYGGGRSAERIVEILRAGC